MNYTELYDVIVNKISKERYDYYVASGVITEQMINDEVWIFIDDQYLSAEDKAKLQEIEAGAQVNIIEGVQVNGVDLTPSGKKVNIVIPTKLSELTDDKGYLTEESDPTVPAWAKAATKPSYSYDEIANTPTIPSVEGLASEDYVNQKVADLVNSAPETLDTLGEIAQAIQENDTVVEALNSAIGNKANSADLAKVATSGSYNDLTNKPAVKVRIWN